MKRLSIKVYFTIKMLIGFLVLCLFSLCGCNKNSERMANVTTTPISCLTLPLHDSYHDKVITLKGYLYSTSKGTFLTQKRFTQDDTAAILEGTEFPPPNETVMLYSFLTVGPKPSQYLVQLKGHIQRVYDNPSKGWSLQNIESIEFLSAGLGPDNEFRRSLKTDPDSPFYEK